ncbi:MAG: HAD-IB family phosphatase [Chloroflexota bacterium]
MSQKPRTLVQCDFDGTVTVDDVSFVLLDTFARGNWRERLKLYQAGKITVGRFNTEAFSLVAANREALESMARRAVRIRAGFANFVALCRKKDFRLVIVSNGLDFYIKTILQDLGMGDIEVIAARTTFRPDCIEVHYMGPDGVYLDENFKAAWVDFFLSEGYRVAYVGNGSSDLPAAQKSHCIFATGNLLDDCRELDLKCVPFTDFKEVVNVLERL